MTNQHPITPPLELLEQWVNTAQKLEGPLAYTKSIALQAARWGADQQLKLDAEQIAQAYQAGADQELQSCCEWILEQGWPWTKAQLQEARRPKQPSLKEQALDALSEAESSGCLYVNGRSDTIRKALEALPND